MKRIIIPMDYYCVCYPYLKVKEAMDKGQEEISTQCLDFFNFDVLDRGYEVIIKKQNGDHIVLSELLADRDNVYCDREIRKAHNVRKMFVAGAFNYKKKGLNTMSRYLIKEVLDIETNERSEGTGSEHINKEAEIFMLEVGRGMRLDTHEGRLTTSTIQSIEDTGNQKIAKTRNSIYILEEI